MQHISSVKDLAKSRFFWLTILSFVMLYSLSLDVFIGFRDVSISRVAEHINFSASVDINIFKILTGVLLIFVFIGMLQGIGRWIGGLICLFAVFLFSTQYAVTINLGDVYFLLPGEMIFGILFLSWWYVLSFYGHFDKVPPVKIFATYLWMAVLMVGISLFMIFNFNLEGQAISFSGAFRQNEFSVLFLLAISLILLAASFLWKGILNGKHASNVYKYALFWIAFLLPIAISLYSIWGYVTLSRAHGSLLNLEITLFFACFWVLLLFNSIHKYRLSQNDSKKDFQLMSQYLSDNALKRFFQIPVWSFMTALIFSNIFLGFYQVTVSREIWNTFISTSFNLNILAIGLGIVFAFVLLGMLQGKERRVGGWVCLCIAILAPVDGTTSITINEIVFNFPDKFVYAALFLSYWFILVFYSHMKDVALGKAVKACGAIILFLAGIIMLLIFSIYASHNAMPLIAMFGRNELNAYLAMGLLLILLAISFTWKDIADAEGSAKWFCDLLCWGLFITTTIISLFSTWGYTHLLGWTQLPNASLFSLEWVIFATSIWSYFLFRSMYKYRISQLKTKVDLLAFASQRISEKMLDRVIQIPTWLIFIALPVFIYHFYSTSILFN